jgi:hypothetical protein
VTHFLVYERPVDSPNEHLARVYVDRDLAEVYVRENHDPKLERRMVPSDPDFVLEPEV